MSSRFVLKWKYVKVGEASVRTIRARMALRGFQDLDKENVETYAGTASRLSQRILASQCATEEGWELGTLDVSKAFLQGMTYEKIAQLTGEPLRVVHFALPPGAAQLLRRLPGFEDYDENKECLRCVKPGTGTVDTPRGFSLQLKEIIHGAAGWTPTTVDLEMHFKFHQEKASGNDCGAR